MNDKEILDAIGLSDAAEEVKTRTLENIEAIVEMRLMGVIKESMTEDQMTEFEKISQNQDADKVKQWISENVASVDELYEATLKDYIDELNSQSQ